MTDSTCRVEGCTRGLYANAKRLCSPHYQQERAGKPFTDPRPLKSKYGASVLCAFDGCENLAATAGLCRRHYDQRRHGRGLRPLAPLKKPADGRNGLGEKWCYSCKSWSPESSFAKSKSTKDGLQGQCRPCRSANYRQNAESVRDKMRQQRFGLTREEFDSLLESQGGRCAICLSDDSGSSYWHTDHDHSCCDAPGESCGQCIRGILCSRCNIALGIVREDARILERMSGYIHKWGSRREIVGQTS